MAGNMNSCKSIIKLQALIRGYLVRKKFSQMKYIYTETVKCIEGDSAQATWRNDCKLCLPTVDRQHSDTRQRVDVLTDNLQQKNCCEDVCSSSASGQKDVNSSVESSHVETCTDDIITSDSLVANVDYESTDKLSHSKDMRSSLTQKMTDRTIKHIEIPQENVDQLETYESTQTFIDETNCNTPTQDQMLYPNDKTSLIKLHQDLTMELLWIEQAIESRISYLTMKENLDKQAKDK